MHLSQIHSSHKTENYGKWRKMAQNPATPGKAESRVCHTDTKGRKDKEKLKAKS
jgi:hypothetical protein